MILDMRIRNVALIPELSLTFGDGLTLLTGETGAGKSILLGALSLLLGERASADTIRAGCDSASVEAVFAAEAVPGLDAFLADHGLPPVEEGTLVIRRELSRSGRGKCTINGGFATLAVLEALGKRLVDLHGQHEHQSLLERARQRDLLDAWAELTPLRSEVSKLYADLRASREARERLALDEAERMRRLDLLNYQLAEIDEAKVKPGEYDALQEERLRLANAERLQTSLQEVLDRLHRAEGVAVRDGLARSADALSALVRFDPRLGEPADALRAAEVQIADVVERLAEFTDSFEADPGRLEQVEERLALLQRLQKKYGENEPAILAFREQAAAQREGLTHQDEQLEALARAESELNAKVSDRAHQLSVARLAAAERFSRRLETELKELGFARAVFVTRVTPREDPEGWAGWGGKNYRCTASGADEVEFLIGPNPGEEPKPVAKTASGGELSRIMLAIKVAAAAADPVPTLIFDEIDAGIGGATAEAVGRKLAELSRQRQVIVITHLPQIARFGKQHWRVSKQVTQGRTVTTVEPLADEQRVVEMARLLAGEQVTETALQHARELLEKSRTAV